MELQLRLSNTRLKYHKIIHYAAQETAIQLIMIIHYLCQSNPINLISFVLSHSPIHFPFQYLLNVPLNVNHESASKILFRSCTSGYKWVCKMHLFMLSPIHFSFTLKSPAIGNSSLLYQIYSTLRRITCFSVGGYSS